jgi:Tfp pilus assembly protein PilZ
VKKRFNGDFSVDGASLKGTAIKLSEYGLFIQTKLLTAAHSLVQIQVPIAPQKRITLQGEVIWIRGDEELADESEPLGMGVELLQPPIAYLSFARDLRDKLSASMSSASHSASTSLDYQFTSPAQFLTHYLESLCRGCAFIDLMKPLSEGDTVRFKLEVFGWNQVLSISGQVAYRL